ncbi:oxygenase MpaB family protein [Streptomyces niveiscabiei]|uniref:oxygenase MpaB family protein n=1 Tax=Streptomyces niveiscabiei TaxID=164115 RepID=UPI0029B26B88|nr:oxygenase MpaB family protein [Streptomyces niveiscabiei]MDX3386042.1 oxygenase MpaB family protein [Streptomyces niveiscabiei]
MNDDPLLDRLRQTGDPTADAVVRDLMDSGRITGVNQILRAFDDNGQQVPDGLPEQLADYLRTTGAVPDWADPRRISGAYAFFEDDGMQLAVSLCLSGMVGSYASPHAARVMTETQRLNQPARRMAETFQFILYLMAEDPLGENGRLIRACQKVRLVHATVRNMVLRKGNWDHDRFGTPINQEQMLTAVLMFSVGAVAGARALGVHVTPKESADYYHLWCVTAALLGMDRAALPASPEAAETLWRERLRPRVWGPSPEGVALTGAFIAYEQKSLPTPVRGLVPAVIRRVTDPRAADWMRVPASPWSAAVSLGVGVSRVLENAEDRFPAAERVLDRLGQKAFTRQAVRVLGGQEQEFDLPESLRAAWLDRGPA